MKTGLAIAAFLFFSISAFSQYYLRGEVKDERNTPLSNVKILLHSKGYVYHSGSSGGFGIMLNDLSDSLTFSIDGYQPYSTRLDARVYQTIVLKPLYASANIQKKKLLSFTKNLKPEDWHGWSVGGETYSSLVENEFVPARKFPETGFAINIDKASYSNVRRFLKMQTTVPPDAIRIEEMLNYFNFGYKPPLGDSVFHVQSAVSDCPWNAEHQLLFLQVFAKKVDLDKVPPSNLVFLIDVSGSMDMPNRLPLLKSAFKLLVNNLRDKDTVSIVVYGSSVGVMLPPTSGKEKEKINKVIEDLNPAGATPGESGIRTAYRVAKAQYIKGGNNRVILATDGDFNVGQASEEDLENLITQHQQSGIYLTCLGVGMGNYKDSKLEVLARKGNGNFAYLDDEKEAEKVLVKELTQTLYTVADDAYLDIKFNPNLVKEYRLIGFDNKLKALADSVSELEGGEIGSGHSLMTIFEFEPAYGADNAIGSNLASVNIRYRIPEDTVVRNASYNCSYNHVEFKELPDCHRFSTAVVMFGGLLKMSKYYKGIGWNDAIIIANQSYNPKDVVQKEMIELLEKAKRIYAKEKKRKKDG
ncbi:MAG TPA: von Willebrand factor type A domain-containing protein [Chitinophagaceae bacterium]|nr:von Willebrand factor type A domain-containing protein [Chitinophagaceae bacterium]